MKTGSVVAAVFGAIIRVCVAVAAIYLIYNGAVMCYNYGYRLYTEPPVTTDEKYVRTVTVAITPKMSTMDIARLFEANGLVRDANLFFLQYYASEFRENVKTGTFELNTGMTAEEMMEAMTVVGESGEAQ